MIGQTLSHYQILEKLGEGGMGVVYRALDIRLNRPVAIKVLPPDAMVDADRARRFMQEARAASALNHPHIITVHEVDASAGIDFIVMEYVTGSTLEHLIGRKSLTLRDALKYAAQIADALAAAHRAGIVHRDLKPGNVMITERGDAKVLDFGLAKLTERAGDDALGATTQLAAARTESGTILGTAAYMSPEQAEGKTVDARSDIFAFGSLLYEMVTGRRAFRGETKLSTLSAILDKEPPPASEVTPGIPPALDRIIAHCLRKDPSRRFQHLDDVKTLLEELKAEAESGHRDRQASASAATDAPRVLHLRRRGILAACAVAALCVGGFIIARVARLDPRADQAIDSIVVLPFSNASGDPDADYLSDGITESLINSLSKLPELRVIARTTAFRYKDKETDPRKLGEELHVRAVVMGKLIHRGNEMTIQVDLVDTATGTQLWGDRYPRKLQDLLTVQNEVVTRISEKLRPKLSGQDQHRMTRRYTENYEAYQLYARGRYEAYKMTTEGMEKGIKYLNQALQIDPTYALAHAGLAETYMAGSGWYMTSREAGQKAKEAALKALALDGSLDDAHGALAIVLALYEWDWPGADREFKQALGLNPGSRSAGDNYGLVLAMTGRQDEALAEQKRALQVDPLSVVCNANLGYAFYWARHYDDAIEQFRKSLDLDPNFWFARIGVGFSLEMKGLVREAAAEFQRARQVYPHLQALAVRELSLTGRTDDARKALDRLKHSSPPLPPWDMAFAYMSIGEKDEALAWLEKARDDRFVMFGSINVDPLFDSLRSNPRFADLLRSVRPGP